MLTYLPVFSGRVIRHLSKTLCKRAVLDLGDLTQAELATVSCVAPRTRVERLDTIRTIKRTVCAGWWSCRPTRSRYLFRGFSRSQDCWNIQRRFHRTQLPRLAGYLGELGSWRCWRATGRCCGRRSQRGDGLTPSPIKSILIGRVDIGVRTRHRHCKLCCHD